MARPGRRPGKPDTRDEILVAARQEFAAAGYDGATIRGIAATAGVDPALVMHYFGSKDQLFATSLELPVNPADLIRELGAGGSEGFGERLVGTLLETWDGLGDRSPLVAALRTAMGTGPVAETLRQYVTTSVVGSFTELLEGEDASFRGALIGTQLAGMLMGRYILEIEPLASAGRETLIAAYGPTIQRYGYGDVGPGAG
jgi:AcrR family transcriptional regulator